MKKIYKYDKEPPRFNGSDIEPFMIWAVDNDTSDVTITSEDHIWAEIHGKKYPVTNRKLTKAEVTEIISHIYKSDGAVAKLNGGEDVDPSWEIRISRDKKLRFRVNMTSALTVGQRGFSITIRTIKNRPPLLEDSNLPQEIIDNITQKQGLIMIAGATGSGKSTLLASVIDWRLRDPESHIKILTYEAPIEYTYDEIDKPSSMICQTEIHVHLPSFAHGVRNALRRKPDVILMGEMRDTETIGEGVTASMTGHLVYGTIHANGVADCIRRMVNVFPNDEKNARAFDIVGSLNLIVAQKLIPSTDGKRVPIREYMVFNDDIRNHLMETEVEKLTLETKRLMAKYGQSFLQDATKKFEQGLISEKEYNKERIAIEGSRKAEERDLHFSHEEIEKDAMRSIEEREMAQLISLNSNALLKEIDFAVRNDFITKEQYMYQKAIIMKNLKKAKSVLDMNNIEINQSDFEPL